MSSFLIGIIVSVVALNILFLALQLICLHRRWPWPWKIGLALCLWTLLMLVLFFLQGFAPVSTRTFFRRWLYFPLSVEMVWNLILLPLLTGFALLITIALRLLRPVRRNSPAPSSADLSRRKFVYLLACGTAPVTAIGMGVHGSLSRYDLRVRRFDIPIARLAPELEGFTIAHVSDLHSGVFCGPKRLRLIASATNDLKADLIVITGDIINNHMGEFPNALAAIRLLRARYGIYLCEGNHDIIPGPGILAHACISNGLALLYNQTATIPVEGQRLLLGGLQWLPGDYEGGPELVSNLFPERQVGDVRILLAHHPHFFDSAQSVDLLLSGHTHGGQIMLGPVGLGPLFFRYWSGKYQRNSTTMIVSNGSADWFPCRIGAPAEIGLLRLTRAA